MAVAAPLTPRKRKHKINSAEKRQQRDLKMNLFIAFSIVLGLLSTWFLLSWHYRLTLLESTLGISMGPSSTRFTSAKKEKGTRNNNSTSKQRQRGSPASPNASSAGSFQIKLPRGLDLWNATTWSIVQQYPENKHRNISLLVRFFREFLVGDFLLETERQLEEEARVVQRARENLYSILRKGNETNMMSLTGNHSNDCLLETLQNETSSNATNNATTKPSNVDSLIRLQETLGFPVCWLDPDIRSRITPWSTIADKYGDEPRIIGLEQCHAFRQAFPKLQDRWLSIAGLFHSGTNLLFALLSEHCDMRPRVINRTVAAKTAANSSDPILKFRANRGTAEKFEGVAWQVTWGKHNPAHVRDSFTCVSVPGKVIIPDITKSQQLPVVIIRHPYPWMESMCYQPYSVRFSTPSGKSSCPKLFTNHPRTNRSIPVEVKYGSGTEHYESVAHMYNEWYDDYLYNATFPRLAVRMEDLIHHPKVVIQQVCECAGGIFNWNTTATTTTVPSNVSNFLSGSLPSWALLLGSVKEGKRGHNMSHSGFLQAWTEPKLKLVSQGTKRYSRQVLDSKLMELFHYKL